MRTSIYIDGFNFYYGAVAGTPYRWINVVELCRRLLPGNEVTKVRYFTALVKDTRSDRTKSVRQQTFIRALETLPEIEVTYGSFLANVRRIPLARAQTTPASPDSSRCNLVALRAPSSCAQRRGDPMSTATMLVADAFQGAFEAAAVLSTDSDLALPIELVRRELGLPVGVLFPKRRYSVELDKVAAFKRTFDDRLLRQCQLPEKIRDEQGRTITKPAGW